MTSPLIVALAREMRLSPNQAVALPAVLDSAAKGQGRTRYEIVQACRVNPQVKQYIAEICKTVTK